MVAISKPPAQSRGSVSAHAPSAYGNARHHLAADLTGDGDADGLDLLAMQANWGNYGVGDINRDGTVDGLDLLRLQSDWGKVLVAGELSSPGAGGTDNIVGYAGYIFNAEMVSAGSAGLYTVRHRHYAPDLGRWLSRDPLGMLVSNPMPDVMSSVDDTIELNWLDEAWRDTLSLLSFNPESQYDDGHNLYQYGPSNPLSGMDPAGGPWWLWPVKKPLQKRVLTPAGEAIGAPIGRAIGNRAAKKAAERAERERQRMARRCRQQLHPAVRACHGLVACKPGLSCEEYTAEIIRRENCIRARRAYLLARCDYVTNPGNVRNAMRLERGHRNRVGLEEQWLRECRAMQTTACMADCPDDT